MLDLSEYNVNVNGKKLTTVSENTGLQLIVQKTKIMTKTEDPRNIMVNGRTLEIIEVCLPGTNCQIRKGKPN